MSSSYLVHRSEKSPENPYAQISRKMAQDSGLSFQARGLMLYILSKPLKWKGKAADLQREGKIKAKALKTILAELIDKRYVIRHEDRNKRGCFEYKLEVFEEPELNSENLTPEECLTVPPSGGVGADPPSRLPREVGSAIDSTGARAFSFVNKKELVRAQAQDKPRQKDQPIPPPYEGQPFLTALAEFEASQKELRCPIGPTRRQKLYAKLEVWGEPVATYELNRAVEHGWKGVFREQVHSQNGFNNNGGGGAHVEKCDPDRPSWMAGQRKVTK